jgi:Ca2+-binding RTX toxin-like protein
VNYTVGGTATLGSDYTGIAAAGTTKSVTFAAGSATAIVTVDPSTDTTIEPDETVALTLAAGTGYTVGTSTAVVGTIRNDDLPTITLAVAPATGVAEDGAANLIYTFSRSGPTTSALTVNYTVGGTATLGTDYTGIATTGATKSVTFAAGSATAIVTVDPTADTAIEANETVTLTLAVGTGYTIGTTAPVVGTILNDDLTLYNASTPTLPSQQGWLAFGGLGGSQSRSTNGTTLTSSTAGAVGYSNRTATTNATLVNSAFPSLNRNVGFSLDFRLQVLSESHQVNNRAGFSVILLDQGATPRGIELGFWSNSIFSQTGGSSPFQTIGERVSNLSTASPTTYSLRILDQAYYLLANNRLVLSGSVQDYSASPKDPLLPYSPYTTSNFLFLGDNTRSASATVELGSVSLGGPLTGTSGADTFTGTVGPDSYNALDGADQLGGGEGSDWLAGGAGSDTLNGGGGDDMLIGGSQADRFLFSSGASFNSSQLGVDTIVDFNPLEDRLSLARTTFSALAASTALASSAFAVVASDAAAATSTATIVYNSATGSLFYNANGATAGFAATTTGGGLFAQILSSASGAPFPTLSSSVFEVA